VFLVQEELFMVKKSKSLNEKLNFINNAKKTNIAKINVESVDYGRVKPQTIILKRHYEYGVH